jgi:hypothetical protein
MSGAASRSIDPATGDFWLTSQPEYWDCAALAWREVKTFSTGQEDARQAGIRECEARAEKLRASLSQIHKYASEVQ